MRGIYIGLLTSLLFIFYSVSAESGTRQEQIHLKNGSASAVITGKIKGYQDVDYQFKAKAGQAIVVDFKPSNLSAYFNVLPPGKEDALFVGSISGNQLVAELRQDGIYTIRVYLMRNAARRNESSRYTLKLSLPTDANVQPASPTANHSSQFDQTLELQGIRFHVTSANTGSNNTLRILPSIAEDQQNAKGYRGHDEFAVLEGVLGRRFPVYQDANINAKPTGGMRQLQYKLVPGEAEWLLKVDKVVEF